jgi:hypothetical protein
MGEDPRPRSWRRERKHELVLTTKWGTTEAHASCSCNKWGRKCRTEEAARVAWADHVHGVVEAEWDKKGLFTRSLSEWFTGQPDPP